MKTASSQLTSTNWAGYAVNSTGVTAIGASWTVPEIQCAISNTNIVSQGVAVWIGFDGLSGTAIIPEQVGTISECLNGTPFYYAWEEDPTLGPANTNTALIAFGGTSGGDYMTASIAYLGNTEFRLNIADSHSGNSRTYTVIIPNTPRASAEWIVEAFENGNTFSQVTLPKFQPITFTGCSAAVNNVAASILQNHAESISMVDGKGNVIATTQDVNQAGTSFQVAEVGSPVPETPSILGLLLPALTAGLFLLREKRLTRKKAPVT